MLKVIKWIGKLLGFLYVKLFFFWFFLLYLTIGILILMNLYVVPMLEPNLLKKAWVLIALANAVLTIYLLIILIITKSKQLKLRTLNKNDRNN